MLCKDYLRLYNRNELDGYTQFHYAQLVDIFGIGYRGVLDLLLAAGLLEVNQVNPETGEVKTTGYYSKTRATAKSYRIPKRLHELGKFYKTATINTLDKVLMNKIARLKGVTTDQHLKREYYRNYVLAQMNQVVLLDNDHSRSVIALECAKRGVAYTDEYATARINAFNFDPVKRSVICAFGTRVHTEITNNLKQMREDFRFGGDSSKWEEIDLVASQPWFLSIITPALIKKFVPECADAIPAFKTYNRHPDLLRFRRLCADPDYGIYEAFRDAYNAMYGAQFTRADAKRICFRAFYTNYQKHEKLTPAKCAVRVQRACDALAAVEESHKHVLCFGYRYQRHEAVQQLQAAKKRVKLAKSLLFSHQCITMFKAEFRGAYDLLAEIKLLPWDFERGTKTFYTKYYANPALLAQRMEASIVYTVVVKALVDAGITRIVTIHDSFCVREQDAAQAKKIIKRAFAQLKLKPSLK
ncbi:hypothetical protein DDQ68_04610 [Hymenobacter nivis]|uniref:DNA-directed DNA polymerase family A palm domain-containing protein n=2 Tax=Hymenobacter nivis TaxID=1850093 RepID=A0A2Z3GEM3_9BACT|nr:hypothetical protein DDQ68_04610 [Hymenobacter nivis]